MMVRPQSYVALAIWMLCLGASAASVLAQQPSVAPNNGAAARNAAPAIPTGAPLPSDYIIGPDDVLTVIFWREKDLSGDVAVRPDGRISLPLLNDVEAAGLTPEQLRVRLTESAEKLLEEPTVTVVVKQINSRKVFITGQVAKPGPYPLNGPTNVVQLIAMAGGILEYADEKNISIMRSEKGRQISLRFNYDEVKKRKNLQQNIELRPGDTVIVP
jgi:polysaccharide export outer membrane protein